MKSVIIGAHLQRDDIEPVAEALAVGDLFLSGLPVADDQPLGDRDLLLRVAKVRAALLDRATFIAIRYGFAGSPPEVASKCAAHVERWRALLEQHRDEVEMTLKVVAPEQQPRPDRRDFTSGGDYLKALHAATTAVDVDPDFRAAVENAIGKGRWLHRDQASLEFAALVARDAVERVRVAGEELKQRFPRVPFLLSGPWPLEVFADDRGE
ncbi:MAG TPA: hypothetical protein VJ901_06720 [Thermoanaerobaculia bacterium]|nr:hypothetical protein [Thermoanaerobaculia bacterium]